MLNGQSAITASATVHPSARVTLAVLKFFLGQDEREDGESDDEEEPPPAAPSREDLYKAKHKVRLIASASRCLQHAGHGPSIVINCAKPVVQGQVGMLPSLACVSFGQACVLSLRRAPHRGCPKGETRQLAGQHFAEDCDI